MNSGRALLRGCVVMGALLLSAPSCGGKQASSPAQDSSAAPRAALATLVPSPQISWAVQLHPARLMADELLRKDFEKVLSTSRLRTYQTISGLDPSRVEELWLAGYPLGSILLLDGRLVGDAVREAFEARSRSVHVERDALAGTTYITGIIDEIPQALFQVDGDFVVIAERDLSLAKIVRAHYQGRLRKTPSALATRLMAPLAATQQHAALRAFLFGPYPEASDAVAHGFAAGVIALDHHSGMLQLHIEARGVWPEEESQSLTRWTHQFFSSREMRALGWGFPVSTPSIACHAESIEEDPVGAGHAPLLRCSFEAQFRSADVAEGTYRITQAPTAELLAQRPLSGWQAAVPAEAQQTSQPQNSAPTSHADEDSSAEKPAETSPTETGQPVGTGMEKARP